MKDIFKSISDIKTDFFSNLYLWFKKNQRDFPWRKNRTPYRVWIAEIMLQQTQSKTTKKFYTKWMNTFPTLKSLGNYPNREKRENEILSLWQGLGYYRRALNILNTADKINQEYKGVFPHEKEKLLSLPGIGPYTAGAILNFGFKSGNAPAMVDSNFIRVVSRLFYLNSSQAKSRRLIWTIADAIIFHPHNTQPRIYNEAMMEIGALICRPHPQCLSCPLKQHCISYQKKNPFHNPYSVSKKNILAHSSSLILHRDKKFLLIRGKPPNSSSSLIIHTHLWRFPTVDRHRRPPKEGNPDLLKKLFYQGLGLAVRNPHYLFSIKHHYTQYQISLQIWGAESPDEDSVHLKSTTHGFNWKWFSLNEMTKVGLSSPDQKIRKFILENQHHHMLELANMSSNRTKKIFIDGSHGTTGLELFDRLKNIPQLTLIEISYSRRKDKLTRKKCYAQADLVVLALPNGESAKAVKNIEKIWQLRGKHHPKILDTSTYFRTEPGWIYGHPQLWAEKIASASKVTNPGCYAIGFITLVYPLIKNKLISPKHTLTVFGGSGYSGGGRKMIADYENKKSNPPLLPYALNLEHKHLREMEIISGLKNPPIFLPLVSSYYRGMIVMLPLPYSYFKFPSKNKSKNNSRLTANEIKSLLGKLYGDFYPGKTISINPLEKAKTYKKNFLSPIVDNDGLEIIISVRDNGDIMLFARLDNLSKGAAGNALENIRLMLSI